VEEDENYKISRNIAYKKYKVNIYYGLPLSDAWLSSVDDAHRC